MIDFKMNANPLLMEIYRSNKKIGIINDNSISLESGERLDVNELKQILDLIGPELLFSNDCGLDEKALHRIGESLILNLRLKLKNNGRVDLVGGDKTPLGLVRTIFGIMKEKMR